MKIITVKLNNEIRERLKRRFHYLNLPLDSDYDLQNFLNEPGNNPFNLDSLARLIMKYGELYIEGDEFQINKILFDYDKKTEILRKTRRNTLIFALSLMGVGAFGGYMATSSGKYPTVDFCFSPRILHSTPRNNYCRSSETVYRTHPKYLLSRDQTKPNPNFIQSRERYTIPAKGRIEKNWNKPSNPSYLLYSLVAVGCSGAAFWLYSQSNKRYSLEFPEIFGLLKAYTLDVQLAEQQNAVISIGENEYRTEYLAKKRLNDQENVALSFDYNSQDLAAKQQAQFEESQKRASWDQDLEFAQFQAQLSAIQKQTAENKRDEHKAYDEIEKGKSKNGKSKNGKEPSKKEVEKQGNDVVKAIKNFKINLEYVDSVVAPSIVRHKFKFAGASQGTKLKSITQLSKDLGLALALEYDPIVLRDKGHIAVEVPRKDRYFPDIWEALKELEKPEKPGINMIGGIDIDAKLFTYDLANGNDCHVICAGTTNSGKTQGVYAQLAGLVSQYSPDELKIAIYDGKYGLKLPKEIEPWLYCPIAKPGEAEDFIEALEEERYSRMVNRGRAVNIKEYNKQNPEKKIPYLLAIFDEYSTDKDAFEGLDPETGKTNLKNSLVMKLAKQARSEGIHLLVIDQEAKDVHVSNRIKSQLAVKHIYKVTDDKCGEYLGVDNAYALAGKGDVLIKFEGVDHRCQMPNCEASDLEKICKDRLNQLEIVI